MTTKRDYAASITTKGLDGTGLTEDVARRLYSRRGRKFMAVAEFVVDETSDKRDGTHKVAIAIAGLELVLDHTDMDNHLRDLQQTIYANRQRADGQLAIDEQLGGERTVADVLSSGSKHRPHPFIPVDASQDNPICDVCGSIEASAQHSTQELIADASDTDEPLPELPEDAYPDDATPLDEPDAVDPHDLVHAKSTIAGTEAACGLLATVGKTLHRHDDREQITCPECISGLDVEPAGEPWEYPAPEGTKADSGVTDPFKAGATT